MNDRVERRRLWWDNARRLTPWWLTAVAVAAMGVRWVYSVTWPASLLVLAVTTSAAAVCIWIGMCRTLGYRPVAAGDVEKAQLVHVSRRAPSELVDAVGTVHLDVARCAARSRMLRADRWFSRPARAVFFFAGEPSRVLQRAMVAHAEPTVVTVDLADVDGPMFRRWDGCIALPHGYRGPARLVVTHGGGPVDR